MSTRGEGRLAVVVLSHGDGGAAPSRPSSPTRAATRPPPASPRFPDVTLTTSSRLRLLAAGIQIEPAPEVLTRHVYPSSFAARCRDQHRRARRRAAIRGDVAWRASLVVRSVGAAPVGAWRMARPGSPVSRGRLVAALPLVATGALCGAAGSLRAGPRSAAAEEERLLHRSLRVSTEH